MKNKFWKSRCLVAGVAAACFLIPEVCFGSDSSTDSAPAPATENGAAMTGTVQEAQDTRARAQESVNALSMEIQDLKQSVIRLNKNLRVMEEDLLFPANTQVTVFLSLDVGKYFSLESVRLKLDGRVVANHTYGDKEVTALVKGGVHRLHVANMSVGDHEISAFFTGMGPSGREYKRGTSLKVSKESGPKYVELKISDSTTKQQPEFTVAQW